MTHQRISRPRVLVTERVHPTALDALAGSVDVTTPPEGQDPWSLPDLAGYSGVIVRLAQVSAEVMDRMPALRVIAKHGAGVDNIDIGAARARGIPVVYAPDATTDAVAEFVVMQMLRLARRPEEGERVWRERGFHAARSVGGATELHGKTLGIVGFGRIGRRLARICGNGLGMAVLAYDLVPPSGPTDDVERTESLDALLERADVVSIHVPLSPATRGLIGDAELRRMRPTAWLINAARGGTVDETALAAALAMGTIAGAAVDVYADEPPDADHPLVTSSRVLASAHVAGVTDDSWLRTGLSVVQDVLRVFRADLPEHPYPSMDAAHGGAS